MKKVYFLNQYNKDYESEGIFIEKTLSFDQYLTYELFNSFGGKVVYEGRAYGEPKTNKVNIDITDLCANEIMPLEFNDIPFDVLTHLNTYSINFRLTIKVRNINTDEIITTTEESFRVVLGDDEDNLNDSNYNGQIFIDQTYNGTDSNLNTRYEIYRVGEWSDTLIKSTNVTTVLPGQRYVFKYKIIDHNIRIKKYDFNTVVYDKVVRCSDKNINTFIYYLNSQGNYNALPVLIDKSIKKRNYTEKTFTNNRKTIKYDIQFKDQLDFKTPFLTDSEYAKVSDFIGSNNVYLVESDNINKVNVSLNEFQYKTFKNTKAFNQFTGSIDFIYTNKRYL